MFIFLSKFLPLLVYPLGLACILLLAGLLLKKQSLKNWLLWSALIILYLGSNRAISYALAYSLEWQNLPPAALPRADVIVVLGGGTEPALFPRTLVEVNGAGDRLLYAVYLYQQGAAPNLLLSGGSIEWLDNSGSSPAEEMKDLLVLMGIPSNALWLESESLNTYENALLARPILQEKGIKKIILVTSALHMPRSKALFEHQGFEVIAAPTDFTVTQTGLDSLTELNLPNQLVNLLPNASSLALTTNVLKEYIGILIYSLRGWL